MLTVFTSLACYPGASPYCHRYTAGCWAGIGGACRFSVPRGDHLPFLGSPVLPPSRLTGGIATPTGRYHGRMLIHPSPPACATSKRKGVCTHAGSGPSRVRRRLLDACLGDPNPPGHVLASSITSFLLLTFCQVPRRNFLQFSHSLSTAACAVGIFIA